MKESRVKTEKAEKDAASKLSKDRIEQYLLPLENFEKWRYPNPDDTGLVEPEEVQPDGEGTEQACSRCKKGFVVSSANLQERIGECHFHHGRLAPERIEGKRVWIYSCCKRARGEAGCEEGVHVYTHGDDDKLLAKRVSYVKVGSKSSGSHVGLEVLGMDCEMICKRLVGIRVLC
jgi:RNA exonuclease 1